MTTTIYGIPNCDTVRKARKWCDAHDVPYEFVDFRETPVGDARIASWLAAVGDSLLNRRSTTWKQLSDAERDSTANDTGIIALLAAHPTLIKRPVLEHKGDIAIGFKADDYAARLQA